MARACPNRSYLLSSHNLMLSICYDSQSRLTEQISVFMSGSLVGVTREISFVPSKKLLFICYSSVIILALVVLNCALTTVTLDRNPTSASLKQPVKRRFMVHDSDSISGLLPAVLSQERFCGVGCSVGTFFICLQTGFQFAMLASMPTSQLR